MIKVMLLVSRRPDISREEFRDHYERIHAPLAAQHLPHLVRYVRNYVIDEFAGPVDCDCVTEFWYDLPGPCREAREEILTQDLLDLFGADEQTFMDRASFRVLVVEQGETPPEDLAGSHVH